jgi:hypothetical protein
VFEHEAFRSGNFDTHFVKKNYNAAELQSIGEEAKLLINSLETVFEDLNDYQINKLWSSKIQELNDKILAHLGGGKIELQHQKEINSQRACDYLMDEGSLKKLGYW